MGWGWGCIGGLIIGCFLLFIVTWALYLGTGVGAYQRQFTAGIYVEVTILLRYHSEKKKNKQQQDKNNKKNYNLKFMIEIDINKVR